MAKVQLAQAEQMLIAMELPENPSIPAISAELTGFSREIADRVEGKPAQAIKHEGGENPVRIVFETIYAAETDE